MAGRDRDERGAKKISACDRVKLWISEHNTKQTNMGNNINMNVRKLQTPYLQMSNEFMQQLFFSSDIEDSEGTGVLWLGRVLKVIDIFRHDLPVDDQVALPVDHV